MSEASARKAVYRRSRGVCERCGNRPATEWHHRRNRSQLGRWAAGNGLHLCSPCHRWVTEHPAESYVGGWLVRGTDDPENDDPAMTPVLYRGRLVLLDDNGGVSEVEANE